MAETGWKADFRPRCIIFGFADNIRRHKELNHGIWKTQEKEPAPGVGP
jgi:hypothetical protein